MKGLWDPPSVEECVMIVLYVLFFIFAFGIDQLAATPLGAIPDCAEMIEDSSVADLAIVCTLGTVKPEKDVTPAYCDSELNRPSGRIFMKGTIVEVVQGGVFQNASGVRVAKALVENADGERYYLYFRASEIELGDHEAR